MRGPVCKPRNLKDCQECEGKGTAQSDPQSPWREHGPAGTSILDPGPRTVTESISVSPPFVVLAALAAHTAVREGCPEGL